MRLLKQKKEYLLCGISWAVIGIFLLFYLLLRLNGIELSTLARLYPPCFFHSITGFYCPGCGGTRAVLAWFAGDPLKSIYYHPIVGYTIVLYGWYLISNTIEWLLGGRISIGSCYHSWYGKVAVCIVFANWIVRNFLLYLWHIPI